MGKCSKCGLEAGHAIGDVGFLRPLQDDPETTVLRHTHVEGLPYEIFSEVGEPRVALLRHVYRRRPLADEWQLWALPYSGGWHAIDWADANWATSGIPEEG